MATPTPAEVAAYLHAYDKATPEQKAQINQAISQPAPATPAPTQTAPTTPTQTPPPSGGGGGVSGSSGGLLSDGQGGFIPAPGTNFGNNYGIVAQLPDGRVVLNTPQGPQGYATPQLAQEAAQQQGIPYQPALSITGSATPDQLNGFLYGVKADGTPSTKAEQDAYIAGMQTNPDGTKKDGSSANQDAFATLKGILDKYGLGSLADWAWNQIVQGNTPNQILQSLRDRPEYKQRFAGMDQRRANGLAPMSEEEYIASESQIADYLQRAGLPKGFYDSPDDFSNLIGSFANVAQVADRVEKGFMQVTQAPQEVRDEFSRWFGVQGDGALAAYFLDPTKAEPALEKMASQARIGGSGLRQGLDVSQGMAGDLVNMNMSDQQIQAGFGQAGALAGLQYQTLDEAAASNAGLSADQIAGGVFGATGQATKDVKNKLDSRNSSFASKGSALSSITAGAIGLS